MVMDKSIFPRITSCTSTKVAWKALKDGYQGRNQVKQVRIQTLKRDFENLKMKDDEKVVDYYVIVQSCVNKMKILGEAIENAVVVKKVLRSLLPKWNLVAIIIEERKNLATITFDQLVGSLMSHERLQDPSSLSIGGGDDKAFPLKEGEANVSSQGRGQGRGQGGGRGRGREVVHKEEAKVEAIEEANKKKTIQ